MKQFFLILLLVTFFSACQKNTTFEKNKTINTNSKANSPKQFDPMNPPIKHYNGKGIVTKINMELGSVELDHEEIKGLMPKMIMEFLVKEKSQLEKLKVGDKVDFVLEDKGGAETLSEIKKSEQ